MYAEITTDEAEAVARALLAFASTRGPLEARRRACR